MFIPGWSDLVTGMNFIRDQEGRQSRKRHRCSHFASCQSSYQASGVTVDSSGRSSGHYCAIVGLWSRRVQTCSVALDWRLSGLISSAAYLFGIRGSAVI